jgi:hypothetical protein
MFSTCVAHRRLRSSDAGPILNLKTKLLQCRGRHAKQSVCFVTPASI